MNGVFVDEFTPYAVVLSAIRIGLLAADVSATPETHWTKTIASASIVLMLKVTEQLLSPGIIS